MDIFNLTNNRLVEMGFESFYLEGIEEIGGVVYKSLNNYVVLKKAYTSEELNKINDYSAVIRRIVLNSRLNINNTYLILCTNINLDYETFFRIERDSKSLRKYMIRNTKDLNRVPFLDNSESSNIKKLEASYEIEQNSYVQMILDYIKENSGQHNKLTEQQINYSVNKVLNLVGDEIENR